MKNRHVVIPVFIPHKGCPFDCIYCNQKAISGQRNDVTDEDMRTIIETHINSSPKGASFEIAFFGGSFTGIEKEQQIRYLEIAGHYIEQGIVNDVKLSTRPDYINEEILQYLKEYKVKTIELGVQSLDEEVLIRSCRGHSPQDVYNAAGLIKGFGFDLGIQTMIGLPGDNREKALYTAREVVALRPSILRIYPTLVIKNTYLEKLYLSGGYCPLSLEEAAGLCAELLELYNSYNIKVIRIGLQPTENIKEGADVVAGPFHPAFRQLVEARIFLKKIEEAIKEEGLEQKAELIITAHKGSISNVIGQKRSNIQYLKDKYGYKKITVIERKSEVVNLDIKGM